MNIEELLNYYNYPLFEVAEHQITAGQLLTVPLVVVLGYSLTVWLARAVSAKLIARHVDPNLVHLIRRIFYVLAIVVVLITTLDFLQVPITAFAFLSGAVAIGFGFGAQNIINNFISGWILMWERPIRIGDFLEVGDAKGRVEAINTRSTRFRRVDGVHMLIPNSTLLENTVVNWTLIDRMTRNSVRVGVAYGSDVKKVSQLLIQAVKEHSEVLSDPPPQIIFEDFGDNALIFDAYFWVNASVERELRVTRSDMRFRINELFEENGIVVAFPQRDIHLDGFVTVKNETSAKREDNASKS